MESGEEGTGTDGENDPVTDDDTANHDKDGAAKGKGQKGSTPATPTKKNGRTSRGRKTK